MGTECEGTQMETHTNTHTYINTHKEHGALPLAAC